MVRILRINCCAFIMMLLVVSCARNEPASLSSNAADNSGAGLSSTPTPTPTPTPTAPVDAAWEDGDVSGPPLIGAWRSALAEDEAETMFRFAMLPWVPASGTKMVVYDFAGKEIVCCVQTVRGELSSSYLRDVLHISPIRIMDLTNVWAEEPHHSPLVVELSTEGALVDHEFHSPYSGGALGGLLLPLDTKVLKDGTLEISGVRYALSRRLDLLAGDDCTIETYVLQPEQGSAVRIEIPYGTN